jgi:hypothetical protein
MYGKYDLAKYAILRNIPKDNSITYEDLLSKMNADPDCLWLAGALSIKNNLAWLREVGLLSEIAECQLTINGETELARLKSAYA